MYRLYRRVRVLGQVSRNAPLSVDHAVERRALLSYAAEDAGAPPPPLRAHRPQDACPVPGVFGASAPHPAQLPPVLPWRVLMGDAERGADREMVHRAFQQALRIA
jgi:hypothetical protein